MRLEEIIIGEMRLVDQLRHRLKGEMKEDLFEDDSIFQRFLRARNHNLDAAESMLRNHLEWRKTSNVDSVLTNDYKPPEVIEKYFPLSAAGFSKEGDPVSYLQFGNLDTRGLFKSAFGQDSINYTMRHFERDVASMKGQSSKKGKPIHQFIYIVDFENLSLSVVTHKPTIEVLIKIAQLYEANYPERLKLCYFINVSFYFTLIWALVKPFLSGPTIDKIHIYGKDGWRNELLRHIDADELPTFLGGNRTDPDGDPMCKSTINFGGIVPESFYLRNRQVCIDGGKMAVVNRKSKLELKFQVTFPDSDIQWEFSVKTRDIGFSLLHTKNANGNDEVKELIPKQRLESDTGVYRCYEKGIYILEFDNTYSWLHNKEIHYNATLSKLH